MRYSKVFLTVVAVSVIALISPFTTSLFLGETIQSVLSGDLSLALGKPDPLRGIVSFCIHAAILVWILGLINGKFQTMKVDSTIISSLLIVVAMLVATFGAFFYYPDNIDASGPMSASEYLGLLAIIANALAAFISIIIVMMHIALYMVVSQDPASATSRQNDTNAESAEKSITIRYDIVAVVYVSLMGFVFYFA